LRAHCAVRAPVVFCVSAFKDCVKVWQQFFK
jgi:hypothetical protein